MESPILNYMTRVPILQETGENFMNDLTQKSAEFANRFVCKQANQRYKISLTHVDLELHCI